MGRGLPQEPERKEDMRMELRRIFDTIPSISDTSLSVFLRKMIFLIG